MVARLRPFLSYRLTESGCLARHRGMTRGPIVRGSLLCRIDDTNSSLRANYLAFGPVNGDVIALE